MYIFHIFIPFAFTSHNIGIALIIINQATIKKIKLILYFWKETVMHAFSTPFTFKMEKNIVYDPYTKNKKRR